MLMYLHGQLCNSTKQANQGNFTWARITNIVFFCILEVIAAVFQLWVIRLERCLSENVTLDD
jgi:hypothetical protein